MDVTADTGPGPARTWPQSSGSGALGAAAGDLGLPWVLATVALIALAAWRIGPVPVLGAYSVLAAGLVAIAIVDLRTGLVPRVLLYPTLALSAAGLLAASAASGNWPALLAAAIGGAGAFCVFAALWWCYPKGIGFGDVRLAGLCGLALSWLGYRQLFVGFLAACVLGVAFGLVTLAVRHTRASPFAPALAAGTLLGVLWGGALANLWLVHG